MSFERTKDPLARALGTIEMQVRRFYRPSIWNAPGGHESSAGQIASHVFQWCAETLLTHSDSRSPGSYGRKLVTGKAAYPGGVQRLHFSTEGVIRHDRH